MGVGYGYGYGYGYGLGNGNGNGNGNGDGDGLGNGYGHGDGYGDGNGLGDGDGYGVVTVDRATPIMAWHYVPPDGRIRYPHYGEQQQVISGLVLECDPDALRLCSYGLHASLTRDDARSYCAGIATRVACSGRVIFARDKLACSRREVIEVADLPMPPPER